MKTENAESPCWYTRRDELESGQVFETCDGVVKLDRRVHGGGTKWRVLDWFGYWRDDGGEVEPGDLQGNPIVGVALYG